MLKTRKTLESQGKGREVVDTGDAFVLREVEETYEADFNPGNRAIALGNGYFWAKLLAKSRVWLGPTPIIRTCCAFGSGVCLW